MALYPCRQSNIHGQASLWSRDTAQRTGTESGIRAARSLREESVEGLVVECVGVIQIVPRRSSLPYPGRHQWYSVQWKIRVDILLGWEYHRFTFLLNATA